MVFYFSPTSTRFLFFTAPPRNHRLKSTATAYVPNRIADPSYVRVLDTTLRDGEQAPGAAMTSGQKLVVARQLARLRVDVIEAGFPAASGDDFAAVSAVAEEVGNDGGHVPVVCGLARCSEADVRAAWEAVRRARRPRIHTFIATSEIHRRFKLRKSEDEVVELARTMVGLARSLGCDDVEFSPEDAGRSDRKFLYRILGEAIKAGATTVTIPDTVGYTMPFEFGKLIADIKANTPGIENVILSTHCHNDLGLATANTLAGAMAGARQVHVTINGIGERAGNASLEEVVMALKCRGGDVLGGLYTGLDFRHIAKASKMVEEYSGLRVQAHKAIVGANAFAHQSGIHQDGMIKHESTYEIMSPGEIGLERSNKNGIVLGKLSGRNALKMTLQELGYEVDGEELQSLFWRFKALADAKKIVTKADLVALVSDQPLKPQVGWQLGDVQASRGALGLSRATVKLIDADGKEHISSSVEKDPVESTYKAVDLIVKAPTTILKSSTKAKSKGIDAVDTDNASNHENLVGPGQT